ncbi:uncharacterized protein F4817DRAFT_336906 [Daldinia loculata]|uniref:uncharacterized protein n=1 Tax=Daldinia loculata TaxID=103429 RepID=UPI0020C3E079|nr:uncharacterized protein F4817DRAFT_336906 [Daldinia loculata]KAI1647516.1 hypothetical protein F4817DRAFT_336906 [Daldinia loculata]
MKYRIRIAFPRWRLIGFRPRSPSCSLSPVSKPFMLLLRTRMGPKSLLAETFYLAWLGVLLEKYGEAHLSLPLPLSLVPCCTFGMVFFLSVGIFCQLLNPLFFSRIPVSQSARACRQVAVNVKIICSVFLPLGMILVPPASVRVLSS